MILIKKKIKKIGSRVQKKKKKISFVQNRFSRYTSRKLTSFMLMEEYF